MLGSRAERGAVGKMERSMGGARKLSSSECQDVETGEERSNFMNAGIFLGRRYGRTGENSRELPRSPSPSRSSVSSAQLVVLFE